MMTYSETIEAHVIKVDIYSKLNGYLEIYMHQWSRSFFDLLSKVNQISLRSNSFCPEATGQTESNYMLSILEKREPKFIETVEVT